MIDSTLKNANILIVDDQESNICVLESFLEIQGFTNIKTTTDPRQVVQLFASFSPDLILLDLMMPHLSGFEVMMQLKSLISANTHLPILVLTADFTSETRQRALSSGATDFLTKPFDLDEVGLRIQNLLYTYYLQQQLQKQNQILEEKVKERTSELEKKNMELNLAKEKAEASDKLKSSFINNISHEIRTPLNVILGFSQMLTEQNLLPEEREEYMILLNKSSYRLINTVTNFMDISLLKSGNQKVFKSEFEPKFLIQEVAEKFRDVCDAKKIKISINVPDDQKEYKINTDKELLRKTLHQLLDNAVKFTRTGTITVGFKKNNSDLHFFVEDTGIGISDQNRDQIFGIFVQENNSNTRGYEGSGIGLSIAKGILELLGSEIKLTSEKGKGSKFYFTFPVIESQAKGQAKSKIRINVNNNGKQTILIAEDNDNNFFYLDLILKNEFTEIIHAWNGIEAVDLCRNHPEVSLVLMDLKMPEMNGFEATEQIRQFRDDVPIIAITAYSGNEDKQMAHEAGCDDFITKPINKQFLLEKLTEYGLNRPKN